MPRFVVLEHNWGGVHWDWMFERDGRLETWAVDEPIEAENGRAARRLPAHRLAYLDYEGPISGDRGSVRRVARGEYEAVRWDEEAVVLILRGDQIRGEVSVRRARGDDGFPDPTGWRMTLGKVD